jgi:hypothetical protein
MALVFQFATEGEPLTRMGQHIANRRWFDWVQQAFEHEQMWHTRLLALIVIGQILGVYRDFQDVPLWGGATRKPGSDEPSAEWEVVEAEQEARDGARDAGAAVDEIQRKRQAVKEDKAAVKRGREELAELRKLCKNAMFVAVAVLCKDGVKDLVRLIAYLLRPTWNAHTEHARSLRAPLNAERFYRDAAAGEIFTVLEETCAILQNVEILDRIGFVVDVHKAQADLTVDSGMVVSQDAMAESALDVVVNLLRERLGSSLWNCGYWPGRLAILLFGTLECEEQCLSELRADILAYREAKEHVKGNLVLQRMLESSCFGTTLMSDVAQLVTTPLIHSYEQMMDKLRNYVRAIYGGWGQTKVVEDTNKVLRDRETRDVTNRRLSCVSYWSAARGGKTIGLHDRTEIEPAADQEAPGKLPMGTFSAKDHTCSLEGAEDIMGTASWRSYTPASSQAQYAHLVCIRAMHLAHFGGRTLWHLAGRVWLACLFRRHMIVRHRVLNRPFLVLDALGACCVLVWLVEEHSDGGVTYFTVGEGSVVNREPQWLVPFVLQHYEVVPTKPVSPLHLWLVLGRQLPDSIGVVFLATGPPDDMWAFAANAAFWDLGAPDIAKFSNFWGVAQPVPELMAMLKRLIQAIIPSSADINCDEVLEQRCVIEPDPIADIVDADVLDDLLDKDETQAVEVLLRLLCVFFFGGSRSVGFL